MSTTKLSIVPYSKINTIHKRNVILFLTIIDRKMLCGVLYLIEEKQYVATVASSFQISFPEKKNSNFNQRTQGKLLSYRL